jgi:serine/threonine protein kinase
LHDVGEPLAGETVDTRYELRRLIARGGMGLVYEAHHKFTRRAVALKLLPSELRFTKESRSRLLREAHALTAVRHPGFVEVLDAGVCGEHGPYVVLEMLEGRTLDGILASRRQLSVEDVVQIGRQVCAAVGHAHARGIVHRDLKPGNVFLARNEIGEEAAKIIDLGVAAIADEQLAARDHKLTTAREVLGTPEYMAPEQLMGRPVDARTDVYAIGMTLFECLTGEVPYTGSYPEVLLQVSKATETPSVRDRRAGVPAPLALVIESALEKDAGARFQSAAELGRALVAASGLPPARSKLLSLSAFDEEPERAISLVKKKKSPRTEEGQPTSGPVSERAPLRRHFDRGPYVTPVSLTSPNGTMQARSEEISEEGMLVLAPAALPLGAPVTLSFATPTTGEIVTVAASVRWLREGRGKNAIGVEFKEVPESLRHAVAEYIAMLPVASAP